MCFNWLLAFENLSTQSENLLLCGLAFLFCFIGTGLLLFGFFFFLFSRMWRLLSTIRVVSGSPLLIVQVMTGNYYLHWASDTTSDKRLNHHNQWWLSFSMWWAKSLMFRHVKMQVVLLVGWLVSLRYFIFALWLCKNHAFPQRQGLMWHFQSLLSVIRVFSMT